MGKKKLRKCEENDNEYDATPTHYVTGHIEKQRKRLIIILEQAQLETVKVKNTYSLLNCDDHALILKKNNRDIGSCRPDITHQCLLSLMEHSLNRAGLLQVYVHTANNILIQINPQTKIPSCFNCFGDLMVHLLHKFSVRAGDANLKLLKVIKNPVTDHLPVGIKKINTSFSAKKVTPCKDLVPEGDEPIAFIIGAMAHGQVDVDYSEDTVSIINAPLSAALTCEMICEAFAEAWGAV